MNDHFNDHLSHELLQLYELFDKRWPKYKDSWKERPLHWLIQRLIGEHSENKGEFTEFLEAIDEGNIVRIRDEALDSIMVLFFIVQTCNRKIGEGS